MMDLEIILYHKFAEIHVFLWIIVEHFMLSESLCFQ